LSFDLCLNKYYCLSLCVIARLSWINIPTEVACTLLPILCEFDKRVYVSDFWHAPPGEVHLFPWCAIRDALTKSVVALTSVKSLLNVLSVLELSDCAVKMPEYIAPSLRELGVCGIC